MARKHFRPIGLAKAHRSGLEDKIAAQLLEAGVESKFESIKIEYQIPTRPAKYTPDFPLPNGIIIETKGWFQVADRQKHLLIQQQHPHLDIRFVFSRSASPIRKGSPTTYADWCRKNGFKFADKWIPEAWLTEEPK